MSGARVGEESGRAWGDSLSALERRVACVGSRDELRDLLDETLAPLFDAKRSELLFGDDSRPASLRSLAGGQPEVCCKGRWWLVSIPMLVDERRLGVLRLHSRRVFTPADLERARFVAPRVSRAVDLAIDLIALRGRERTAEAFSQIAVELADGEDPERLLERALARFGEAIEADALAVVRPGAPLVVWPAAAAVRIDDLLAAAADRNRAPGERPEFEAGPDGHSFYASISHRGEHLGTLAGRRRERLDRDAGAGEVVDRFAAMIGAGIGVHRRNQTRVESRLERERRRIADALHDEIAQMLFAAQVNLDLILERRQADAPTTAEIERVRVLVARGGGAIREAIHRLAEDDGMEIGDRLFAIAALVEREFGLLVSVNVDEDALGAAEALAAEQTEALVRVAREALTNVAKHAGPCRTRVELTHTDGGELRIDVLDDGVGIEDGGGLGYGLTSLRRGVRDCGGAFSVRPLPSGGTKVSATFSSAGAGRGAGLLVGGGVRR